VWLALGQVRHVPAEKARKPMAAVLKMKKLDVAEIRRGAA
jgi:hypothetical protein